MRRFQVTFSAVALLLAGCASHAPRPVVQSSQPSTTAAIVDPKRDMSLEQIAPAVAIAIVSPSTRPASTQPSLAALEYYARGRSSLASRDPPYSAVSLFEKAAQLDPTSAEVQFQLARAYAAASLPAKALAALEQATALRPDWLDAQHELARLQYQNTATRPAALQTLIMATRTRDYASNDGDAASVDFDLARLLQQSGYERAAVEAYEKLLWRLSRKSLSVRGNPEVAALARRPEPIQLELARLYERRGKLAGAIALYQKVADALPEAFDPQAQLIRTQLAAGQIEKAKQRSADLVRKFRASAQSIDLLRDVYRAVGPDGDAQAARELNRLHNESPEDRSITLALAELLAVQGRTKEAESLIASAATSGRFDIDLLRRLVRIGVRNGDTKSVARTLIEATAKSPESTLAIAPLWAPLIQPWRASALKPTDLRQLVVPQELETAKQYWLARVAADGGRTAVSKAAVEQAMAAQPAFAPAWLLCTEQVWLDSQLNDDDKKSRTGDIASRARTRGEESIALMVEAISSPHFLASPADVALFEKANQTTEARHCVEFQVAYALSLQRANQSQKFQQLMWKLISDNPSLDELYLRLINHFTSTNAPGPAVKVVNTWLANDPTTVIGRIEQADAMLAIRQEAAAESLLIDLADETDNEPAVLAKLQQVYAQSNQLDRAVEELKRRRKRDPRNGSLIEAMVALQVGRGDTPAALKELEFAVTDAAGNANLLYYLANLFQTLGEKSRAEDVMTRALSAAPDHVGSNNDLAYFWSEAGRELPRAEAMARRAVAAEPDNSAYLDTLGWVLYKQGKFDEARKFLEQAVQNASPIDPVLVDHLGDVIYRLGDAGNADKRWREAQQLLGTVNSSREEYLKLKIELENKLRQRTEGDRVQVAPIADAKVDK